MEINEKKKRIGLKKPVYHAEKAFVFLFEHAKVRPFPSREEMHQVLKEAILPHNRKHASEKYRSEK